MRSYTVSSTHLMAPPLTTQLHQKKATAAKVKSHSGAGASSASSLGRLLAYDLPLPHDWIRQVREVPDKEAPDKGRGEGTIDTSPRTRDLLVCGARGGFEERREGGGERTET